MTEAVPRSVVEAFYKVYAVRDVAKIAPYLHDDVKWTVSGPVDLLPFCGTRHGSAAVVELIDRVVPEVLKVFSFLTEAMLIDGDRVATLNRLAARRADDGRVISYRVAHFMRFGDGKVTENLSFIDSFDAVQQMLGHPLAPHETLPTVAGDLVAV